MPTIRGQQIKLKNARVFVGKWDSGGYGVMMKILVANAPKGSRVRLTEFSLSPEGLSALASLCLGQIDDQFLSGGANKC